MSDKTLGQPCIQYTRYPIVARAFGLAVEPLGRVRARAKVSCIQWSTQHIVVHNIFVDFNYSILFIIIVKAGRNY